MANNDKEIVELIIDAKNLTSKELNEAATDVMKLGDNARKTEGELAKLKIQSDTIKSYEQVSITVGEMRKELTQAEVAYDNLAKSVKANKNATDEEKASVKLAKRELTDLTSIVKSQENEYRRLTKEVQSFGLSTTNAGKSQDEIAAKIEKLNTRLEYQTKNYKEQVIAHNTKVAAEKKSIAATKELENELSDLINTEEKAVVTARKLADADSKAAVESKRIADAIQDYERTLTTLNQEKNDGVVSSDNYIRSEAELRKTLNLTESQVKTSRAAIQAAARDHATAAADAKKAADDRKKELADLIAAETKALDAAKKRTKAEVDQLTESKRVTASLEEYERELSKLNKEKAEGIITTGKYIKSEANLRKNLELTEKQIKSSRQAIEADSKTKTNATRNTDLLTTATRRLAQVYTVLLASQKAVEAATSGVKEYGALEAAITSVEKTTGSARAEIENLASELITLSTDVTPTTTNELLRFAQVAGQLGTKSAGDILQLVSAADALELSTNLAGDEAVELLARILTMTGEGIPAIHNLSSSVVALGNDFAVSEQDIVHMTKEIISGTREIGLGSAAAAAFGTALKELGQPAERSRTAIQRLSGAIKEASLTGGDDLERLSAITGMTANEIEKNLGDRPEAVIVAFLKGLDGISKSGGIASDALRKMGIDGTEATSVLTVLAGGTDRLEKALVLSNAQYVAADAHMKEAIKSYANQESAIGRLSNQFIELKAKIGEAYSDDVNRGIEALGDIINDTEGDVVSLMEYLPLLIDGLVELGTTVEDISTGFGAIGGDVGLLQGTLEIFTLGINTITIAFKYAYIEIVKLQTAAYELYNAFQPLEGLKISTDFIDNLRDSIKGAKDSIAQDLIDMEESTDRLYGKSSLAYQGLQKTVGEYASSLSSLSVEQQAQIDVMLNQQGYIAGNDDAYRKLTASIIRASREAAIELKIKENAAAATAKQTEETAKLVAEQELAAASSIKVALSSAEYAAVAADVADKQRVINELVADGTVTSEAGSLQFQLLTESLQQYSVIADNHSVSQKEHTDSNNNYVASLKDLDDQLANGSITLEEFRVRQRNLSFDFQQLTQDTNNFSKSTEFTSVKMTKLADDIAESARKVREYQQSLDKGNLSTKESIELAAKLSAEKAKLNALSEKQNNLVKIENATYPKLIAMQRDYQIQLDGINRQFRAGTLTKAEHDVKTKELVASLALLNSILGENTDELEENNDKLRERLGLLGLQVDEEEKVTSALSLEAAASAHLGKVYDFTAESVDNLNKRYQVLQSNIVQNDRVTVGWWANLAKISNEVFQQEKAVISHTLQLRKLTDQVKSSSMSMKELGDMAAYADRYFTSLSDTQLAPLRDAIKNAKDEFAELNELINDTVDDIQDRLDLALGNTRAITERKFAKERAELQDLLNKALTYGDSATIRALQKSIEDLKKAQKLELSAKYGGDKTYNPYNKPNQTSQQQPTTTNSNSTSSGGGVVTLRLDVGNKVFDATLGKSVMTELMREIERMKQLGN